MTELIDRLRLAPPARVLSVLTLQGAVAHVDMPVESGPTLYLPHSQKSTHGYLAYWIPEFQDYSVANHIRRRWPRATWSGSTRP
ncbi:MAG: phytanoyl-CoA dioxygenase family protein [Tetrasphaera sp.]